MSAPALLAPTASHFGASTGKKSLIILYAMLALPLSLSFFEVSIFLMDKYHSGDQLIYHSFYSRLKGVALSDINLIQIRTVGGAEPLYGLLMWVGSNLGIDKNIYISFFNVILCLLLLCVTIKFRVSLPVTLLLFTNYYLILILTAAERLKFSYIILMLMALCSRQVSIALSALAPLFHFQSIINYASAFCASLSKKNLALNKKTILQTLIVTLIIAAFIFKNYGSFILHKVNVYLAILDWSRWTDLINLAALIALSCFISNDKKSILAMSAPIIVSVLFLGPSRINMIGVTMVYYFLAKERKLDHWMMYPMHLYFSYKSIAYVTRIVIYGNGFYLT